MINNINQISLIWQYVVVEFFVIIELQAILKLNWTEIERMCRKTRMEIQTHTNTHRTSFETHGKRESIIYKMIYFILYKWNGNDNDWCVMCDSMDCIAVDICMPRRSQFNGRLNSGLENGSGSKVSIEQKLRENEIVHHRLDMVFL